MLHAHTHGLCCWYAHIRRIFSVCWPNVYIIQRRRWSADGAAAAFLTKHFIDLDNIFCLATQQVAP